jgi:hypothetical protein
MEVKKRTVKETLEDIGIKAICERIADTESQAAIARSLGISAGSLSEWLASDVERSACAREARLASAYKCDDMALDALFDIADDSSQAAVTRQREIASHHRWRAKTRNPVFGDKIQTEHSGGLQLTNLTDAEIDKKLNELL